MSTIAENLEALQQAKEDITAAIKEKGGIVQASDGFSSFAQCIETTIPDPALDLYAVVFYDYDGTILYNYSREAFLELDAMPENPIHENLIAQGWNWELDAAKAYVEVNSKLNIGQTYCTAGGKSEYDIIVDGEVGMSITLEGSSGIEKDWGDGITDSQESHTYLNAGAYTIKIAGSSLPGCSGTRVKAARISSQVETIPLSCFARCKSLEYAIIPKEVSLIRKSSFSQCVSLSFITIPKNIHTIDASTFQECLSLKAIALPNSVTKIEDYAFSYCVNLSSITVAERTSTLGRYCFQRCGQLSYLNRLPGLRNLGEGAFLSCSKLTDFFVSKDISSLSSIIFSDCTSLRNVIFDPDSQLSVIYQACFNGCSLLSNIKIPDSTTNLGTSAFSGCVDLEAIELPSTLTAIGNNCFDSCYKLKKISIPDTVTVIPPYLFNQCASLTSVELGNNVTKISQNVWDGCNWLSEITIHTPVPPYLVQDTASLSAVKKIYIPYGTLSAYQSADGWNQLSDKFIELPEE